MTAETYPQNPVIVRTNTLFGQVMLLVAATVGFFAVGAYAARDLSFGWTIPLFIGAFVCAFICGRARKDSSSPALIALFGMGVLLGAALGPTLNQYAQTDNGPQLIAQAAGLTAGMVAALGAIGMLTSKDLSGWLRFLFIPLLALIAFGFLTIFVNIPNGDLIYCIAGLAIFSVYTVVDFNLIRHRGDQIGAIALAAGIFLDVVNIFLFLLQIMGRR